jgi:hypothetical protein
VPFETLEMLVGCEVLVVFPFSKVDLRFSRCDSYVVLYVVCSIGDMARAKEKKRKSD